LAVIESDPFAAPPTGQFAFTAFVRGKNLPPNSELRLVLQADDAPPSYHRFRIVGGQRPGAFKLAEDWCPYPLLVKDLPLHNQQQLQVRFEFSGPGEWWIDDVKPYDLLFPLTFYSNHESEFIAFRRLISAAELHHKKNQLTDCVRYLEGYWPRFYVAHTAPRMARQAIPAANPQEISEPPPPDEAPGFAEKFWRLFRR
jgi:hypothetical protein